jgi:hypothetical protein
MDVDFDGTSSTPFITQPLAHDGMAFSNPMSVPSRGALSPSSYFGLIIPGGPVHTNFQPVDPTLTKFALSFQSPGDLPSPISTVNEIVFFLLPGFSLPVDHGALIYWQIQVPSPIVPTPFSTMAIASVGATSATGYELLGSVTMEVPSGVYQTGWSENEQVTDLLYRSTGTAVIVNIGISIEPITNVRNVMQSIAHRNTPAVRLFVAEKIAADLFNFMRSFDTGGNAGHMVVPINIFDRWFTRFRNRFSRDPNFFLKSTET